jgi:hypothetical protein
VHWVIVTVFAMCITEHDRAFLAGFLEGEACFAITEQNGGQSLSCSASVRLRDDDQDLLEWLVALTGLGALSRVPAQRTSRPQISWKVDSQADCAELIRLIADCGFHGRRAAEFGIWSTAVNAWQSGAGCARRARLRSLKEQLRIARTFGHGARAARPLSAGRQQTLGYISGLVCAEGCFQLSTLRPRFSMHMRGDERPLLELLRDTTDCGRIYDHTPAGPLNPSSSWIVVSHGDVERLAETLYQADLPGRKGTELEPWFVGVAEVARRRGSASDLAG